MTTIQYICPSESQSYLYIYIMCKQCFIYHCLLVCPITFLAIALSVRLQFTTFDISKRFFFSVGCQHDLYMYIYLYGSLSKYFFYYYAINSQLSTKMIGENIFCPKAQHISIVLPSTFRLVQLRIYTCYTKTCFVLGVTCYFSIITYF